MSPDTETICGVCGQDLASKPSESESDIEQDEIQETKLERQKEQRRQVASLKAERRGLVIRTAETIIGIVVLGTGIALIGQYGSLIGVLVTMTGLIIIAHGIGLPYLRS